MAKKIDNKYFIKFAICIISAIVIMLIPCNETFTPEIRKWAALTAFGILMFLFELLHAPLIALMISISYALFGVCTLSVSLSSWSHSIVFQGLMVLLLLEAVNCTPLLKRIASHMVIKVGGSYFGILLGMSLISLVFAILIPSTMTTILVVGFGYGLCLALNLKPGDKAAVGIMMMAGLGVCEAQNFLYSPQGIGATAAMISTAIPGFEIGYTEIIKDNIIFLPILFVMPFMFSKLFKADNINGVDYFKAELEKIGSFDRREKTTIVILLLMVIYLFTSQWHGLDMAYGYVIAVLLLYLPVSNVADYKAFQRVDLTCLFLVAGCMAIGNAGNSVGVGAAISSIIMPILQGVESSYVFVIFTWLSGVLANLVMTPMALYTMIAPVMAPIAEVLGYSAKVVAYLIYHAGNQVFFPYENNSILMMYAFGMIKMGQFVKGATCKLIFDIFWICVAAVPYWIMLGLL